MGAVKIFLSIPDAALGVRDPVLKMSPEERNIVQEQAGGEHLQANRN